MSERYVHGRAGIVGCLCDRECEFARLIKDASYLTSTRVCARCGPTGPAATRRERLHPVAPRVVDVIGFGSSG